MKNEKIQGGLRIKGVLKKSKPNCPLISVITVTFNAEKYLTETIKSVLNQTYDNIEYIIIDGGSTDKSIEIINNFEDKIDYWISEPDKGAYDAMNKGAKSATGDFIIFMNADDYYYKNNVIEKISKIIEKNNKAAIVYGKVLMLDVENNYKSIRGEKLTISYLEKGKNIPSQAAFLNRKIFLKNLFDIQYKISADFDFTVKMFLENRKLIFFDIIISVFRLGGISSDHIPRLKEVKRIIKKRMDKKNYRSFLKIYYYERIKLPIYNFLKKLGLIKYWVKFKSNINKN